MPGVRWRFWDSRTNPGRAVRNDSRGHGRSPTGAERLPALEQRATVAWRAGDVNLDEAFCPTMRGRRKRRTSRLAYFDEQAAVLLSQSVNVSWERTTPGSYGCRGLIERGESEPAPEPAAAPCAGVLRLLHPGFRISRRRGSDLRRAGERRTGSSDDRRAGGREPSSSAEGRSWDRDRAVVWDQSRDILAPAREDPPCSRISKRFLPDERARARDRRHHRSGDRQGRQLARERHLMRDRHDPAGWRLARTEDGVEHEPDGTAANARHVWTVFGAVVDFVIVAFIVFLVTKSLLKPSPARAADTKRVPSASRYLRQGA